MESKKLCDENKEEDSPKAKDDRPLLKSDSLVSAGSDDPSIIGYDSIEDLEEKCAAYVRKDVYGTVGCGELPLLEKVLVGIALVTLVPIRIVVGMFLVVLYYIICRLCTIFSDPNPDEEDQGSYEHVIGWRRRVIVLCGRYLSRTMLFVMGFYWIKETFPESAFREQAEEIDRPGVVVSNHVSYLDILYHVCSSFPSFVAKRSVTRLPLIGLISKCLGCVYVQREAKSSDSKGVSGIVTNRIKKAQQNTLSPMLMLFPEGTTTNGNFLLPFKTGSFLAKVPVLPVLLKYPYERFSPAWDSISGIRHVILLLCQFVNHLEVTHLPIYFPSEPEKADPKLYANNVRNLMATEDQVSNKTLLSGISDGDLYHVTDIPRQVTGPSASSGVRTSTSIWHRRLGHPSSSIQSKIQHLLPTSNSTSPSSCSVYPQGFPHRFLVTKLCLNSSSKDHRITLYSKC